VTGKRKIEKSLRAVLTAAVVAGALVLPAQATAKSDCSNAGSDPTAAQYCSGGATGGENTGNSGNNGETKAVSETSPTAPATVETGSGSLPFTGLDVGILALVAAGLVGAGLLLRRLTAAGVTRS
jgi:hypothetical protein